tara:strand:+ start:1228 stop:1350 length:123 start_codon:yes stop_codon:yes gene_type:complete
VVEKSKAIVPDDDYEEEVEEDEEEEQDLDVPQDEIVDDNE